jgi:hydrogenase expression/formation protein HypD
VKYIDEYRDAGIARSLAARLRQQTTRPWVLMEICGGQTHTIMRYGIDEMLPPEIELVHGPGCPVCVTPVEMVDRAIQIASRPDTILVSYGDMLRVPGSATDLLRVQANGGQVRMAYTPLEALKIARSHPDRRVVFFAVGFETTAPANAMAVWKARAEGISNFSMLVSHVLVPPAIRAILDSPEHRVQGFIAPGHVCTVMGYREYEQLATEYRVPFVVGGFEPVDLLESVSMLIAQLEHGRSEVENQYVRSVTRDGNPDAQRMIHKVFEVSDRIWRGIGRIPLSGYRLRDEFAAFDADRIFHLEPPAAQEPDECISTLVLQGLKRPVDCAAFGTRCTPQAPLGAPMVSSEGACAAYYQYRRCGNGSTGSPR